jgi:hypothetical protein
MAHFPCLSHFPLLIPLADSPRSPCSLCSLFQSPSTYLEPSLLWQDPSTSVSDCLWTELPISLSLLINPSFQNSDPPMFLTSKYTLIRTVSRTWLTRSSTVQHYWSFIYLWVLTKTRTVSITVSIGHDQRVESIPLLSQHQQKMDHSYYSSD